MTLTLDVLMSVTSRITTLIIDQGGGGGCSALVPSELLPVGHYQKSQILTCAPPGMSRRNNVRGPTSALTEFLKVFDSTLCFLGERARVDLVIRNLESHQQRSLVAFRLELMQTINLFQGQVIQAIALLLTTKITMMKSMKSRYEQ